MTITARLSRTLHLALGEDGAADMTNWMNTVDEHRVELRELNELSIARFEAKLGQVEARLDARISQVEMKIDQRFADLLKWSFLFWCGTMAVVLFGQR